MVGIFFFFFYKVSWSFIGPSKSQALIEKSAWKSAALWLALASDLWNQNWGQTPWKPAVSLSFLFAKVSLLNAELKTDWRLLAALGSSWLVDRGGSPASFLSLPAKVSGLDADALHRLPSSRTNLGVSEIKLKVSTMRTQSEVALYSWVWSDSHQQQENKVEVLALPNK